MRRPAHICILVIASAFLALVGAQAGSAAALECGATITTDTTLTADLLGCADGLTVEGPVTLDLGGHTIGGVGGGVGVQATSGASVRNGLVSGFAIGVSIGAATLEGLKITGNQVGVEAAQVGLFSVRDNAITKNGIGMEMSLGRGDVTGNRVMFNSQIGIRNGGGAEPVTYAGNFVFGNEGRGIYVSNTTTRFIGNTVSSNASDGIYVVDVTGVFFPYLFADNVADSNRGFGIAFFGVPTRVDPPASVDGGGNAAKHNANPLQCLNVDCAFNRGLATNPVP
jgi:hypothetical protein